VRTGILLCLCCVSACAGTTFDVQEAPHWSRADHRISTFGVKRDGLMSRDGYAALGPNMPAPFGGQHCDVAFSEQTFGAAPELAHAIDTYVRLNGVTDALLGQLAPAAKGDAILFISVSGSTKAASDGGPNGAAPTGRGGGRGGSGMGGMGRRGGGGGGMGRHGGGHEESSAHAQETGDGFQVSASLYSVREKRSVSALRMHYSGSRVDEALREFNQRIEAEFPGTQCSGWDWSTRVDPDAIRKLEQE
jgi:hypothetical protein